MRNRVIKAVEWFYLCVMMSIKFWWVLIKNFIVYGIVNAISSIILYYASPKEEKDLHQKLNTDTKCNLEKSGVLSVVTTFLISMWIALAILVVKTRANNIIIAVGFWIFAAWSILMLTYIVNLGLVMAIESHDVSKDYYLRAIVYMIKFPQISIMTALLWIVMCLLIIKNAVIAVFIMPGLIAAIVCKTYRMIEEKNKLSNKA